MHSFWLCLVFALAFGAPEPDHHPTDLVHTQPDISNDRVGPDYVNGPWHLMPDDHPFTAWTKRPRIAKIVDLLVQVASTVTEMEKDANQARQSALTGEQQIITDASHTIESLHDQISTIQQREQAYEEIIPTQTQITNTVNNALAPELKWLSDLEQESADLRFPFAERLADFSQDLQGALRAKVEMRKKFTGVVSAEELKQKIHEFDDMIKEAQQKIDNEVAAATKILNKNTQLRHNSNQKIDGLETEIKESREQLKAAMDLAIDRVPREEPIKVFALNEQQDLVNAMHQAGEIEDKIVTNLSDEKDETIGKLRHIVSLLGAMLDDEHAEQSGTQQLRASQKVYRPVD